MDAAAGVHRGAGQRSGVACRGGSAANDVAANRRGANISDLPIQFPTKFELMINLKTAKVLELPISESLLLRADKVIE
jgi:putative ABC transport system substrate-binding protein